MQVATAALATGPFAATAARDFVHELVAQGGAGGGVTNEPLAVFAGGVVLYGVIDGDGYPSVIRFDPSTRAVTSTALTETANLDDHDRPAILALEDGSFMAVWATHNDDVFVVTSADGVTWSAASNVTSQIGSSGQYTYPRLFELGDGIYVFLRDGNSSSGTLIWSKSTDGGSTWSSAHEAITGVYFHTHQTGERIDFAAYEHPTAGSGDKSLRHGYFTGGTWYTSAGVEITATQPFARTELTEVVSVSATHKVSGWDMGPDQSILYVDYDEWPDDRMFRYAKWNGSSWDLHDIADAGGELTPSEPQRTGGGTIDPNDADTVYLALPADGTYEVWRYRTDDDGATWDPSPITTDSSGDQLRPFAPRPTCSAAPVAWLSGDYTTYTNYDLGLTVQSIVPPT